MLLTPDKLPLRAIVAFAVRCARRVQPLGRVLTEYRPVEVEDAIASAEGFARGGKAVRAAGAAARAADAARAAARAADIAAADATDAGADADTARAAWDTGRAAARAAARGDLHRLRALDLGRPGTMGKPIDPAEEGSLGPLWTDAAPDWYTNPPKLSDESNPPDARRPVARCGRGAGDEG
jgi:hypothetical protein